MGPGGKPPTHVCVAFGGPGWGNGGETAHTDVYGVWGQGGGGTTALQEDCVTQLPTKHCAFSGCRWTGSNDEELLAHLCAEHVEPLDTVAGQPPACQKLSDRRLAAHHGAITHVVQGGAPTVAYSIGRRCIYNYAHSMRHDSIERLVCFSCARR